MGGRAVGQSAAELFAEGNALVRSGVYRTALLRYREAAAAGLESPLLHYNLGVAYYELAEYAAAADEFARAAADPSLAALATYNRGLAERAGGDAAAAGDAFAAAERQADARALRRLAQAAGESLATRSAPTSELRPPSRREADVADERAGEFRLVAAARVGQDDNVYRTPGDPYVDLADPTAPLVTPSAQSATFMPVDLLAAYVLHNESGDTDFEFRYDLDGDFYGTEFANANRVSQRFSMGADIVLGERERRRRTVESAFFIRDHRETNFDPDDGLDREIDGVDISDRFSYGASGVQGEFYQSLGPWGWGFDMRFERREYERTLAVANYDQEYYFTGVNIDYDFTEAMNLSFGLSRYRRIYDERPARDLTGALLPTNPAQQYDYRGLQIGVTRQVGRAIEVGLDYLKLDRIDEFLGYYDYTQDVLRMRATFRPGPRFELSLAAVARTYDFPNAFAFNVTAGGPRELEELGAELRAEYRITPRLALWAELRTLDVTSTDARAQYARAQTMLGAEWRRR
jgi:hypothetical protein